MRYILDCMEPKQFIDPSMWPEGAYVRWWRQPRPRATSSADPGASCNSEAPNNNVQSDSSVHGNEEQDNTIMPQPISDNTMTAVPERGSNDTVTDATMIEINVEDTDVNHV